MNESTLPRRLHFQVLVLLLTLAFPGLARADEDQDTDALVSDLAAFGKRLAQVCELTSRAEVLSTAQVNDLLASAWLADPPMDESVFPIWVSALGNAKKKKGGARDRASKALAKAVADGEAPPDLSAFADEVKSDPGGDLADALRAELKTNTDSLVTAAIRIQGLRAALAAVRDTNTALQDAATAQLERLASGTTDTLVLAAIDADATLKKAFDTTLRSWAFEPVRTTPIRSSRDSLSAACKAFCTSDGSDGIPLCAFDDANSIPTRVAAAVDPASVRASMGAALQRFFSGPLGLGRFRSSDLKALGASWASLAKFATLREIHQKEGLQSGDLADLSALFGGSGALADQLLTIAIGLGKFALDRAKQEAVTWALQQATDRLCIADQDRSREQDALVRAELTDYWLPNTCAFALKGPAAAGYGSGAENLEALIAAIREDLRRLPGAAGGFLAGALYWSERVTLDGKLKSGATTRTDGEQMLLCGDPTFVGTHTSCNALQSIRTSATGAVIGMMEGENPLQALGKAAGTLDRANRIELTNKPDEYSLDAPALQLGACALSVASRIAVGGESETEETEGKKPKDWTEQLADKDKLPARIVAGLVSAPACWTLVGRGFENPLDLVIPASTAQPKLALDRGDEAVGTERLTTILRLSSAFSKHHRELTSAWREVDRAFKRIRKLRKKASDKAERADETIQAPDSPKAPELVAGEDGPAPDALAAAAAKYPQLVVTEETVKRQRAALLAVLDLGDAALDLAETVGDLALELASNDPGGLSELVPGLQKSTWDGAAWGRTQSWGTDATEVTKSIKAFDGWLSDGKVLTRTVRASVEADWSELGIRVLRLARSVMSKTCPAAIEIDTVGKTIGPAKKGATRSATASVTRGYGTYTALGNGRAGERGKRSAGRRARRAARQRASDQAEILDKSRGACGYAAIDRYSEYTGLLVALLTAESSDDVAKVVATSANPPGGWRRKGRPGAFTLSLSSLVGVFGGGEHRFGQYGVYKEKGELHGQAPTLSVPIGLDFAWGMRSGVPFGFFLPFIDPAAFLAYDVSEGGRLPGARPTTVLSPGFGLRIGIPRTPFVVLPMITYRPNLRTWEPTVNEPGADVIQWGLSLAVDATMWNVVKR